jgi:hypothetical protein
MFIIAYALEYEKERYEIMNKKDELSLLMQAVESVDVLVDGETIDNMADLAGVEPTDELKRLIFAENLQDELQDLLTAEEPEVINNICPPLKKKWDFETMEAIEQAFRCGYYYAMTQAGQCWQTTETDRILTGKLAKKMQLIHPQYAIVKQALKSNEFVDFVQDAGKAIMEQQGDNMFEDELN